MMGVIVIAKQLKWFSLLAALMVVGCSSDDENATDSDAATTEQRSADGTQKDSAGDATQSVTTAARYTVTVDRLLEAASTETKQPERSDSENRSGSLQKAGPKQIQAMQDMQAKVEASYQALPQALPALSGADAELRDAMLAEDCSAALTALEAGANANTMVSAGQNALFVAIYQNNTILARALLAAGADTDVLNTYKLSPLRLATARRDRRMAAILLARMADYAAQRKLLIDYATTHLGGGNDYVDWPGSGFSYPDEYEPEWTLYPPLSDPSSTANSDGEPQLINYALLGDRERINAVDTWEAILQEKKQALEQDEKVAEVTETDAENSTQESDEALFAKFLEVAPRSYRREYDSASPEEKKAMFIEAQDWGILEEYVAGNFDQGVELSESTTTDLAMLVEHLSIEELQTLIDRTKQLQRETAAVMAILDANIAVDHFDPNIYNRYYSRSVNAQAVNLYLVLTELAQIPDSGFTKLQLPPFDAASDEETSSYYLLQIALSELGHDKALLESGRLPMLPEHMAAHLDQYINTYRFRRSEPPENWGEVLRREAGCDDGGKQWLYALTQWEAGDANRNSWLFKAAANGSDVARNVVIEDVLDLYSMPLDNEADTIRNGVKLIIEKGSVEIVLKALDEYDYVYRRSYTYDDDDTVADVAKDTMRMWLETAIKQIKSQVADNPNTNNQDDELYGKILRSYVQYYLSDDFTPNLYPQDWDQAFAILADPAWAEQRFAADFKRELVRSRYSLELPEVELRGSEFADLKNFIRKKLIETDDPNLALLKYEDLALRYPDAPPDEQAQMSTEGLANLQEALAKNLPGAEQLYLQALISNDDKSLLSKDWDKATKYLLNEQWLAEPANEATITALLSGNDSGVFAESTAASVRQGFIQYFHTAYLSGDYRSSSYDTSPEAGVQHAQTYFDNLSNSEVAVSHPLLDFSAFNDEQKQALFLAMAEAEYVQFEDVKWLADGGVDPMNLPTPYFHDYAAMPNWSDDAVIEALHWWEAAGGDHDQRDANGDDLLMRAIRVHNLKLATHLLYHGADINKPTNFTGDMAKHDTILKFLLVTWHEGRLKTLFSGLYFDLPPNAYSEFQSYHSFHVHRDVSNLDGFYTFTILDAEGESVNISNKPVACWYDDVTTLMWDRSFNLDDAPTGKQQFTQQDSTQQCGDTTCDAEAYVKRLNETKHCGRDDWRVPTLDELKAVHDNLFPETFHGDPFATLTPNLFGIEQWGYMEAHEQEDSMVYDTSSADPAYALAPVAGTARPKSEYTGPNIEPYLPIKYAETYGPAERIRIFDEFYPPEVVAARKARAKAKAEALKQEADKAAKEALERAAQEAANEAEQAAE